MFDNRPTPKPAQVKKFYFLDYFLILLESCELHDDRYKIFLHFRKLKDKERLGESKYKKLTAEPEVLSERQVQRYRYTFDQVITEASNYGLILNNHKEIVTITDLGKSCLNTGRKSKREFYYEILDLMESKYFAFHHLVEFCYEQNTSKNGLLIFPIYSPRKLGFAASKIKTNGDWYKFSLELKNQLERDLRQYLEKEIDLNGANNVLLDKLHEDKILDMEKLSSTFDQSKYNAIIGRIRKYWLTYFLKDIYCYKYSFDIFNIWVERGKQLGILHSSEVHPDFDGRLVYPTSLIIKKNNNSDFRKVYAYGNETNLYIHTPNWDKKNRKQEYTVQQSFVENLYHLYYDIKKNRRAHFVRLSDLREKVCFKMKYIFRVMSFPRIFI